MKKIISVLLCVILLLGTVSFSSVAAKDKEKTEETTEFVLQIDVNKRYTDFVTEPSSEETDENADNGKTNVYIAILCAALVVSVVILAVSLKKVPKEEEIDISGKNKIKKDKENKE